MDQLTKISQQIDGASIDDIIPLLCDAVPYAQRESESSMTRTRIIEDEKKIIHPDTDPHQVQGNTEIFHAQEIVQARVVIPKSFYSYWEEQFSKQ